MSAPRFPPALGLAVTVVSVSFAAILFRLAEAPPLTASFWRLALAVVILAPFTPGAWSTWRRYTPQEWWLTVGAGVALGLHFALWVSSLFLTTVAASLALVTLQAIFVAVGGHLILGDRLTGRGWAGVVVAVSGAILIAAWDGTLAPDSRTALLGDLLAVLGGIGSAAYMLVGRRLRQHHGLVAYVTPVYAMAALSLLVALLLSAPFGSPGPLAGTGGDTFLWFVLLAAVPMLGGHTMANWCLRHMEAHVVATWILLEPVGGALLAWPILGEVPGTGVIVGGVLVLLGAMQTVRPRNVAAQASP